VRPAPAPGAAPAQAQAQSDTARECAQIFQRLSLGENRPDLIERAKTLKCR
jgi:hypothetical protein